MRLVLPLCVLFVHVMSCGLSADEPYPLKYPHGLTPMKIPADSPLTVERVKLGKQLYFDKRLSVDDTVSCASCHDPKKGWSNGDAVATGIKGLKGGRSSPTIINSGYQMFQFWDGRALHLEGQALGPIENPIEMNLKLDALVVKLKKIDGYRDGFKAAFNGEINKEDIAKAIASFERTVLSGDAPYDRHKSGDEGALSESALRGMKVFFNKANCSACHAGRNFTDGSFHNIGVGIKNENPDLGRFEISKLGGDRGAFKTPTLREIARTAPYMHDGSMKTLEEVVEFYVKGGIANPQLDEEIFPLKLTDQDKADLVTFLKEGLAGKSYPDIEPPELPK